jgi:hypothetical protein
MDRQNAIAWVRSVCTGHLRKSQARTLSVLVAAALVAVRVSLANLGRVVPGSVDAKHKIKRAWRFFRNERVEVSAAMSGVLGPLLERWRKVYRKKPLLVSLDWTDLRGLQTLMAAAVVQGRSVPLLWASCSKNVWKGHRSRNGFEESLLLLLRALIPKELGLRVVILADRGFGRTELGRFCQRYGLDYIIRIQPKVMIQTRQERCRLDQMPVHRGLCRRINQVLYRAGREPLQQHLVLRWKKGLPPGRDECWYLMTSLSPDVSAYRVSELYGRRMGIEEFFRDAKSRRHGWSLRDTGLTDPDRLDRLILVLAIAYLILVGLGLHARQHYRPGRWCSNQRPDSLSVFRVGQLALPELDISIATILSCFLAAVAKAAKWG